MNAECLDDATLDDFVHARLPDDARAVAEAHVDACLDCSAIVRVLAGGTLDAEPAESALLAKGATVGRHVIVEPVGSGAMGVVYLAYDPDLDRRVALKLVRPGSAPGAGERMLREAQAMARVAHPNVVAIHDVGRLRGAVYLAMEFVEGTTLRAWSPAGAPRPWSEVCSALVQAGRGLAAAHAAGLVHRDFKPDNVLVGADGRVRVTDFGLARVEPAGAIPSNELAAPVLTRTGALLGTPPYMAPELFAGGEATPRSDQYAFGVALYEAAFGARPFEGKTIGELRAAIERGPSPPAKGRAQVQRIVLRALAARPEDRYPSLDALLAELDRGRERPRGRWVVPLAAVSVVALIASGVALTTRRAPVDPCASSDGLGASVLDADRSSRIRAAFVATGAPAAATTADRVLASIDAYRRDWTSAHRSTCEATAVRHEQSPVLLDARMHCLARRREDVSALVNELEHATTESVSRADEAIASLPRVAACSDVKSLSAMEALPLGEARVRLDRLEIALATARAEAAAGTAPPEALATAARLTKDAEAVGYRPAIAETKLFHGLLLRRSGALADAARVDDEALVAAEAAHDDRTAAFVWLELLALRNEEGNSRAALAARAPVTAALARLGNPPDLEASMLFELGVAATNMADFDRATQDLDACLAARERAFGKKHFDVARTFTALGNLARSKRDLPRALDLHEQALAIDTELVGPVHPALARHHHNIGGVLRLEGKLDLALARYEQALELETRGLGPRHRSVGRTENSLGLVYLAKGDLRTARAHLDRALDILGAHPDRALALHNLGLVDAGEGKHATAIGHYDEAIAVILAARGGADESLVTIRADRATSEAAIAGKPKPPRPAPPVPSARPRPPAPGSYGAAESFDHERR